MRPAVIRILLLVLAGFIGIALLVSPKPWTGGALDDVEDYVRVYSWWAALINLLPIIALALTACYWAPPLKGFVQRPPAARMNGACMACVLGAMVLCAAFGAFRLGDSFWDDEEFSVRRSILGTCRITPEGVVKQKRLPWTRTLWYYKKPTNHVFQSVLSRMSLGVWRTLARPSGLQVNEVAIRLPCYIAGILSVGVLALVTVRAGFPRAGALAAWLLALHPWHIRMASEARGYSLVFLLTSLAVYQAFRIFEKGRGWLAFLLTEILVVWTWPPAIVFIAFVVAGLLIRTFFDPRLHAHRAAMTLKMAGLQVVAAVVLFQLYLPCLSQVLTYAESVRDYYSYSGWLKDVGFFFLTGTPWTKSGTAPSVYLEYLPFGNEHPLILWTGIVAAAGLLAAGTIRWLLAGSNSRWLVPALLLPAPILFLASVLQHKFLYEWYLIFALPGMCALVATGALWPAETHGIKRPRLAVSLAVIVLAGFAVLTMPGRDFLLTRSAQMIRDSVEIIRPGLDPNNPQTRDIITVTTTGTPELYDPRVTHLVKVEQYLAAMREADASGRPLYVNNGALFSLRADFPEISALLDNPEVFELLGTFTAYEPYHDRQVRRYRPGTIVELPNSSSAAPKDG